MIVLARVARVVGVALTFGVLLWRVGAGPFLDRFLTAFGPR